jgi:hypothetical protein
MRMARKPSAVARELLRNFPKGGKRRRKRKGGGNGGAPEGGQNGSGEVDFEIDESAEAQGIGSRNGDGGAKPKRTRRRKSAKKNRPAKADEATNAEEPSDDDATAASDDDAKVASDDVTVTSDAESSDQAVDAEEKPVKAAKGKAAKPKASKEKAAKPKAAAKRKRQPKVANGDGPGDSEALQMDIPGAEGDPVVVSESDD